MGIVVLLSGTVSGQATLEPHQEDFQSQEAQEAAVEVQHTEKGVFG